MPTKKKLVASKGTGKGKRKQCSQIKLTHGVARTFQMRVWIIFYICIMAYIVKYGERSACSERTKEIHVVSALYSNDTPIQDCDHLSMRG